MNSKEKEFELRKLYFEKTGNVDLISLLFIPTFCYFFILPFFNFENVLIIVSLFILSLTISLSILKISHISRDDYHSVSFYKHIKEFLIHSILKVVMLWKPIINAKEINKIKKEYKKVVEELNDCTLVDLSHKKTLREEKISRGISSNTLLNILKKEERIRGEKIQKNKDPLEELLTQKILMEENEKFKNQTI